MAAPSTPAPVADDAVDRSEVSRTISMVRHELSGLVQDAARKKPFYSKSQSEAAARRDAAFKALTEFAAHLDSLKRA